MACFVCGQPAPLVVQVEGAPDETGETILGTESCERCAPVLVKAAHKALADGGSVHVVQAHGERTVYESAA